MELPYTTEVYFATMAVYNRGWFPVAAVGVLLSLIAFGLVLRPWPQRERTSARFVGATLAFAWVWVGWVHQHQLMGGLNFMAPVYGYAWIAQGVLLALACIAIGRVRFRFDGDLRGWVGLALALAGLVAYPLAVLLLGYGWDALPLVGTAPDPTAVFTLGLLLAARERPPLHLFVLPVGWALVAGASAYMLRFPIDYIVPAAAVIGLGLAVRARLRTT